MTHNKVIFLPKNYIQTPFYSSQKRGLGFTEKTSFYGSNFILDISVEQKTFTALEKNYEMSSCTTNDFLVFGMLISNLMKKENWREEEHLKLLEEEQKRELLALNREMIEKNIPEAKRIIRLERHKKVLKQIGMTNSTKKGKIFVKDVLEALGLSNSSDNREMIIESILHLSSVNLKYSFLNEDYIPSYQAIKKGIFSKEYKEKMTSWYEAQKANKDKNKKIIDIEHFRNLISNVTIDYDSEGIVIYFNINSFFLENFYNPEIQAQFAPINLTVFNSLKGNVSKLLFSNLVFAHKNKLSEEYLFDLLDLKAKDAKSKRQTIKKALDELVSAKVISKYSYEDKFFTFYGIS